MFLKQLRNVGKSINPFKTPNVISDPLRRKLGDTTGRRLNNVNKKVFSKRNVTVGLGGIAATGATLYGGNKLYNHIKQKNRKWYEIL